MVKRGTGSREAKVTRGDIRWHEMSYTLKGKSKKERVKKKRKDEEKYDRNAVGNQRSGKCGQLERAEEKSEQRRMRWGPKASHRVSCQNDKWELIHPSSPSPPLPQSRICLAPDLHFSLLSFSLFNHLSLSSVHLSIHQLCVTLQFNINRYI